MTARVTAFERRPVVRVDSVVMGRHPKPVTEADLNRYATTDAGSIVGHVRWLGYRAL